MEMKAYKFWFATGSQDLYGDECLKQVAEDSRQMAEFLNEKLKDVAEVELTRPTGTGSARVSLRGCIHFHRPNPGS